MNEQLLHPCIGRPRERARRGVVAIDIVLDRIEERHLADRPRHVPARPEWVAVLEHYGGLSVPDGILELRDTLLLHGALLDWQEELLSVLRGGPAEPDAWER